MSHRCCGKPVPTLLLDHRDIGMNLGSDCPVVTAMATLNGQPMMQRSSGGAMGCDDPPYCESQGHCLVPEWFASFPAGFPPSSDGMLTFQLTDAGAPATMVSALDMWADATISDVTSPTDPAGTPQATVTVAPRPPYTRIGTDENVDLNVPLLDLGFTDSAGRMYLVTKTKTATPNVFLASFPSQPDLLRPASGQLALNLFFGSYPSMVPTPVWTGVGSCQVTTSAELPSQPIALP